MPKLGKFEMAVGNPDRYVEREAHIVGSFAVHRRTNGIDWAVSHRATGMAIPELYPETKREAVAAAKALDAMADWSLVTRTEVVGRPHYGIPKKALLAARLAAEEAMILATHGPAEPLDA